MPPWVCYTVTSMAKKDGAPKEVISCGAVAWRRAPGLGLQVLLVRQFAGRDRWGIPKGHVDDGESLQDCARREVLEEAGVAVRLGERLPDAFVELPHERKTVVSWLATLVDERAPSCSHPLSEVAEARWFTIDGLPPIVAYQRSLLDAAVVAVLRAAG